MGTMIASLPLDILAESSTASSVEQRAFETLPYEPYVSRLTRFGISLDKLKFKDIDVNLALPVEFALFMDDGMWNCQNQELSILAFGPTVDEAVESFSEDFLTLWNVIANSPDEELTVEAQRVKNVMRNMVASITGPSGR
jgi:hypothetical protein